MVSGGRLLAEAATRVAVVPGTGPARWATTGGANLPLLAELTPRGDEPGPRPAAPAPPDPPTAALCFNDVVAIGVLHGLTARGMAAGRDFAVVGFDDVADAALIQPALTSVSVESRRLGERAAGILLDLLEAGRPAPQHFTGEARLIVRASCGAQTSISQGAT